MNDFLTILLAWTAGVILGAIFFGSLWWTIRMGIASAQPAFWFVGSLLLRMSIALVGFYLVSGGQWQRMLACLVGFVVARFVVSWMTLRFHATSVSPTPEANHAP